MILKCGDGVLEVVDLGLLCFCFFFFNDTATTEIYTLSLHDALPITFQPASLMDYREQQEYLRSSRAYGAVCVFVFLVIAGLCLGLAAQVSARLTLAFALVALALASSLYYTPDYLHLTVVPDKKQRWQVKIRWRIVAAVLVLGLLLSSTNEARVLVVAASAWLALCNRLIKKLGPLRLSSVLFFA